MIERSPSSPDSFSFADDDLDAVLEGLSQEGVDITALLESLSRFDPDRKMWLYSKLTQDSLRIAEQAAKQREIVNTWEQRRVGAIQSRLAFLAGSLEAAARALAEQSAGKRKKLDTPWGYVQLKNNAASLVVDDEDAAVKGLAFAYPDCVKQTATVVKSAVKKLHSDVIAALPGLHLEPGKESVILHPYLGVEEERTDD